MWPTIATPWSSRSNSRHDDDAEAAPRPATRAPPARTGGGRARAPAKRARRPASRAWVSPRLPRKSQSCSKKSPVALLDAEELRDLADHDRERQPDDEALEHRLRDEVGEEARAGAARRRARATPVVSASMAVNAANVAGRRGEVGDRGGRQRRRGRHRPDHEVPRAPERGVQDQRRRRGVQTDHGRDAGDRRVGERLGHQHRPHREPGDQVAAEP